MAIEQVGNGDKGKVARDKINLAIDEANKVAAKMDKVPGATENSPAAFDNNGQVKEGSNITYDAIKFNTDPPVFTEAGTILWNKKEYTLDIITGLGATIQVGQEILLLYYNDTGAQIDNFTTLHPKGAAMVGGIVVPTPEKASAHKWELCEGTLAIATHDIPAGELGFATRFGKARGGNSTGWTPGVQLWLSSDGSGKPTATKPQFPNYSISLGGSLKEHASEGVIFVSITKSVGDTFHDSWDGAIRETFNFTTSSNGTIITGLLENINPANNLTLFFSDGAVFFTLDTTTAPLTIELTPGADDIEQKNYVYIPIETKVLTLSTSGFPTTEHCRVAELDIQSALTTQIDGGVLGNQNTNDHIKKEDDNGHILHAFSWIREQYATMRKKYGSESSFDNTGGNGYVQISGGSMLQAHLQILDAFSMVGGDSIRVWNDSSGSRPKITNLTSITSFSDGSLWNNEWGKIIVWRVGNKTGEYSPVMFNLPSDGYNSEASAIADLANYADYSIPDNFKTKAVLIAAFTFRISGGAITYSTGYEDLRGQLPITVAGGSGGGGGVSSLLALEDVFISNYTGKAGYDLEVNGLETGVDAVEKWLKSVNGLSSLNGNVSIGSEVDNSLLKKQSVRAGLDANFWIGIIDGILSLQSVNNAEDLNNDLRLYAGIFDFFGTMRIADTPTTDLLNSPFLVRTASTGEIREFFALYQLSTATNTVITPTGNYKENEYYITALTSSLTINAPSATPLNGNTLVIRIDDDGTSRALSFNIIYEGELPTTTTIGTTMYCGFEYHSTKAKWQLTGFKEV
jgi:hypothetical protein